MKKQHCIVWAGALALIMALIFSGAVFADGDAPPETPIESAEAPPAESPPDESAAAPPDETAAPAAEEEIPADMPETGDSADEGEVPSAPQTEPTAEIEETTQPPLIETQSEENLAGEAEALAQSDLTLIDGSGEPLDLASQASADILSEADPYFTSGGVVYSFTAADCNPDVAGNQPCGNPIQAAINYIQNNGTIPNDRNIYVQTAVYSETVLIDGSNPNINNLRGLIGEDTGSGNPTLSGSLTITNLTSGFTLSNFNINGLLYVHDSKGKLVLEDLKVTNNSGNGIVIENYNGEVRMEKVNASGNKGNGAKIDNSASTSKVYVTNSKFEDNNNLAAGQTYGLQVTSRGAITIDGVSASRNEGNGMDFLYYTSSLTIKNSTIVNNDTLVSGYGFGLNILSPTGRGSVLLDNVLAKDHPHASGIFISTMGSVTAKNINSHNNFGYGLYIDNKSGTGSVYVSNGDFYTHANSGLAIYSRGTVALSSVRADDNNEDGVFIDNCDYDGITGKCLGRGNVTVTSPSSGGSLAANHFFDNDLNGLEIVSGKAVYIYNVAANGNKNNGVWVRNIYSTSPVYVKVNLKATAFENFSNEFVDNDENGLYIQADGSITVDRFYAKDNIWDGLNLQNPFTLRTPGVTLSNGLSEANSMSGIAIETKGSVTLTNVSAINHTSGGYGVSVGMVYGALASNVTVKSTNGNSSVFSGNSMDGLYIFNKGNIYLYGVDSFGNSGYNAILNNSTADSAKSVTIRGSSFDESVSNNGLWVFSKGSISLYDVTASDNDNYGAYLQNHTGSGSVSVTYGEFNGNANTGLLINSTRAVSLSAVSASGNTWNGAEIDNCQFAGSACTGTGGVTINASSRYRNEFNDNGYSGLLVYSGRTIYARNFTASDNDVYGVFLNNEYSSATGGITISGYSSSPNLVSGNGTDRSSHHALYVTSNGTVAISYTIAENNVGKGAWVNNLSPTSPKSVTISDSSFIRNGYHGLQIDSDGSIILSGVDASHNSIFEGTMTTGTIYDFLSWEADLRPDKWWFNGSSGVPLTITLTSPDFDAYLELYDKDGYKIDEDDNGGGGTNAAISLPSLALDDYYILVMDANGNAGGYYTLTLPIFGNSANYLADGVFMHNPTSSGTVTIKPNRYGLGLRANDNNAYGLEVTTTGTLSISKVWAEHNRFSNIKLNNDSDAERNVSLGYIYTDNASKSSTGNHGLLVNTRGNLTLSRGSANGNSGSGLHLIGGNSSVPKSMSISYFDIADNLNWIGLYAITKGNITLNTVTVNRQAGGATGGAYLDNCFFSGVCQGSGDVIITGRNNEFNDNGGSGLLINTNGDVSLYNFSASRNTSNGVSIGNNTLVGRVTLKNTLRGQLIQANDNGQRGITIQFLGNVSITSLNAAGNQTSNLYIDNTSGTDQDYVTLNNCILSGSKTFTGADIASNGAISLTSVYANENFAAGLSLRNGTSSDPQSVTLKKVYANSNSYGVFIISKGNVELNTVQACHNTSDGVNIDNDLLTGSLTVKGSYGDNTFINNGGYGLIGWTGGEVYLDRIVAISNHFDGINVIHMPGKSGNLTGKRLTVQNNESNGLQLTINGSVNLDYVNAMGNGSSGNFDGLRVLTGGNPLTLRNSVFIGNTGNGIDSELGGGTVTPFYNVFYYGNDTNHTLELDWFNH